MEVIDEESKLDRAIELLKAHLVNGARGMVFCGTKRRCDFIDRKIKAAGLRSAGAIHGERLLCHMYSGFQASVLFPARSNLIYCIHGADVSHK